MRHYAGILSVLGTALHGLPASAEEHAADSSPRRTESVAVFPDVTPGPAPSAAFKDDKPNPPKDPSLDLLTTNPYEAQLAAAQAAQNLYGDDLANPYVDEARLANPYTDTLRYQSPYSPGLAPRRIPPNAGLANPYSAVLRAPAAHGREDLDFDNPYRQGHAAERATPLTAPARPGTLIVETGPGFYGSVFVDGVGVMHGAGLPVLPGTHTVTVYPAGGAPFSVSVDVPQGASRRVRVGP